MTRWGFSRKEKRGGGEKGRSKRKGGETREKRKYGEAKPVRTRKCKARQGKARQGLGGARQGKGEQVRPWQEILMMLEFPDKKKM